MATQTIKGIEGLGEFDNGRTAEFFKRARQDVMDALGLIPEAERTAWRSRRQDRHRTSMNDIGEAAYGLARRLRLDTLRRRDMEGGGELL